jgi:hypothetical protein
MASRTIPTSVKVFGIIDLVFGSLGLLSALNSLANFSKVQAMFQQFPALGKLAPLIPIQTAVSTITPIVLLALGIGLLKRQPWARSFSVYFAMFVIGFGLLNLLATVVMLGGASEPMAIGIIAGTAFGIVFGAIYYGLMIYFLTRPEVIEVMD